MGKEALALCVAVSTCCVGALELSGLKSLCTPSRAAAPLPAAGKMQLLALFGELAFDGCKSHAAKGNVNLGEICKDWKLKSCICHCFNKNITVIT